MRHVMFDIDGTLIESYAIDSECFTEAVKAVTGFEIDDNWSAYQHVTDAGIVNEFFEQQGLENQSAIAIKIKQAFLNNLQIQIEKSPVVEVPGANAFISALKKLDDVVISLATGGWHESAILKLASAGIDIAGLTIASSNDHYSRIEIMKIAEQRATEKNDLSFTYIGDGSWDLAACKRLGVNFILVGNRVKYQPAIHNFNCHKTLFQHLGWS